MRAFAVAPDSLPRGARAIAGESAGETPRRLPGAGVELLQLREYASGDALSRIDWKATARRGSLVSREYSEAQHLEILLVIDASRASRVRAGDLDRLGLYANVAARLAEHAVSVEDRVGLLVYAERTLGACLPDRGMRAVTRLRRALEALGTGTRRTEPGRRRHPGTTHAAAPRAGRVAHGSRRTRAQRTAHAGPEGAGAAAHAHRRRTARRRDHAPVARRARSSGAIRPSRIAARAHRQRAQEQVASLRQQGVVVLDEPDDALDRAVFDAYLQLRRRKRV